METYTFKINKSQAEDTLHWIKDNKLRISYNELYDLNNLDYCNNDGEKYVITDFKEVIIVKYFNNNYVLIDQPFFYITKYEDDKYIDKKQIEEFKKQLNNQL